MKRRKAVPEREREAPPEREWLIQVPNDPVVELVVLAAMLVDPDECDRLRPLCPADAFYSEDNRRVRAAIELARIRGHSLDPATLARLDPDVDVAMIERATAARPNVPEDIDFHVDHLLYDFHRAKVARGPLHSFLEAFNDPRADRSKLQALGRQLGAAFEGKLGRARFLRDTSQVINEAMAQVDARKVGLAYPYGIDGLDFKEDGECRVRPGAAPGGLTLLTGTTGSGKTTIAANLILGMARKRRKVLVGAWEVLAPMTIQTLAVFSLKWSRARFLEGKTNLSDENVGPTAEEKKILRARMEAIAPWVVFMDNPSEGMEFESNVDFVDVLEEHVQASGCDVAVWDLLDRGFADDHPSEEKKGVKRLLNMGSRQRIHNVVVHQQNNKGSESRTDGVPTLGGVRGSQSYIDAATLVLAPRMPSQFKDVPADVIELYGLKQRDAPPFAVRVDWDPNTGQLSGGVSFKPHALEGDETVGSPMSRSFAPKKLKGSRR